MRHFGCPFLGVLLCALAAGQEIVRYENVAAEAGLTHVFPNGGVETKR